MWFLFLIASALAQTSDEDPSWAIGLPIALVTMEGPEGGLPEERLDPLLRSVAGQPLDPHLIRLDLTTLFRVGSFQAVQADVRPSVIQNEDGAFEPAVQLTYQIYPAPRLSKIRVEGARDFSDRELIDASGLRVGETFYGSIDDPRTEARVRQWLRGKGYRSGDLNVVVSQDGTEVDVTLQVQEGEPDILDRLAIVGNLKGLPGGRKRARKTIKRWARKEGVKVGDALPPSSILNAQQQIRSNLASMQGTPFRRPWRRIGSRVTPALVTTETDQLRLTYTIEPGPALHLDTRGLVWGQRKSASVLGIDERLRLTRGFLEDAPERMEEWLQERGFLDAEVAVDLVETRAGQAQTLFIDIERGPRHRLPRGQFPDWVGIEFTGNEAITSGELQAFFDQTSPDVIRKDWYTEAELNRGMKAAEELYRTRGYQSADLELVDTRIRSAGTPLGRVVLAPIRWIAGTRTPKTVMPSVKVYEGPQTLLASIELVGAAPEVDLSKFETYRDTHVGQPFSPQEHQALAQHLTELHREAGYLDANVRVVAPVQEGQDVHSTLAIHRGPKVLLRSAVVRGAQRTREAFLQREMDLTLGAPLSSVELMRLRTDLYALGIFQNIQIEVLGDGATRDLVLQVRERKRWAFEAGAGLSTDQGVRTFGRASRRNLWGLAHRLDLIGQIGVDYSTDTLIDYQNVTQNLEGRAAIEYTAPRFIGRPHTLVLDALLRERRVERTWEIARSGGGVALDTRLQPETQLRTSARLEYRQLQEVEASALLEGEPWLVYLEQNPDLPSPARTQPVLSAFFVHDSRPLRTKTSRGQVASILTEYVPQVDWAAPWSEGAFESPPVEFLKAETRLGTFLPLGSTTIHLSTMGGHARTLGDVPVPLEDRFVLGGTGSMRGFARNTVGPRNLGARVDIDWPDAIAPVLEYTVRDDPDRWAPTGGDTYALGTLEWLVPWTSLGMKSWDGYSTSLFVDVGNAWLFDTPAPVSSQAPRYSDLIPTLRVSSGIGLRIDSPVGPLQLDLASNLQTLGQSERARFLRTDWEEVPFRVHLALGALL